MNCKDHEQLPNSVIYEVYETNADLEILGLKFQGFHRDIAETKMFLLFRASGYGKDFVLWNRNKKEIEVSVFCAKTKQLRGECQG